MSQLSTIASLLGSIAIQDDEIDADELAELQSGDRNRPLNRLEAALKRELGDADLDLATQAIATLRAVNAVRNSLQHPESRGGLLQVGRSGRAVSDVAAELGASWHAINDAVIAYGSALLDADSTRVGAVEALGVDEVLFARLGRWRTQAWSTSIVDVGTGQLLDVIEGRSSVGLCDWLAEHPRDWLDAICWAVLDLSGPWRLAFDTMLPDASQVADPFGKRSLRAFEPLRRTLLECGCQHL